MFSSYYWCFQINSDFFNFISVSKLLQVHVSKFTSAKIIGVTYKSGKIFSNPERFHPWIHDFRKIISSFLFSVIHQSENDDSSYRIIRQIDASQTWMTHLKYSNDSLILKIRENGDDDCRKKLNKIRVLRTVSLIWTVPIVRSMSIVQKFRIQIPDHTLVVRGPVLHFFFVHGRARFFRRPVLGPRI